MQNYQRLFLFHPLSFHLQPINTNINQHQPHSIYVNNCIVQFFVCSILVFSLKHTLILLDLQQIKIVAFLIKQEQYTFIFIKWAGKAGGKCFVFKKQEKWTEIYIFKEIPHFIIHWRKYSTCISRKFSRHCHWRMYRTNKRLRFTLSERKLSADSAVTDTRGRRGGVWGQTEAVVPQNIIKIFDR